MCWMCNMMLVFFSCSTSKFWVVSFRVGIPIWAVAGHHPLGGFSRGFIKEWSNLDLLDPLGWGEEGPWIHMFRTRFHTQKKKNSFKMFKFQDPICSSRKRRIHVFFWGGFRCFLHVFANRWRPIWTSSIWWGPQSKNGPWSLVPMIRWSHPITKPRFLLFSMEVFDSDSSGKMWKDLKFGERIQMVGPLGSSQYRGHDVRPFVTRDDSPKWIPSGFVRIRCIGQTFLTNRLNLG